MENLKFTYWQEGTHWIGYLHDYPEYVTQGESLQDLMEHLKDIFNDIHNEKIPGKRYEAELVL